MNRMLPRVLLALVVVATAVSWPAHLAAQGRKSAAKGAAGMGNRAEVEKTLLANERAVSEAVAKGDAAKFKELVLSDSWSIDPMMGRSATADFANQLPQMAKTMKMTSWDITDVKTFWIDQDAAVLTYKWTGNGTYQGQPVPSPVWASTVWSHRAGKWQAVFHQETLPTPPPKR